jgi:hypothetical protein
VKKKQHAVRLNDATEARVAQVGAALMRNPAVAAALGGEGSTAAAIRYIIAAGLPIAERDLGVVAVVDDVPEVAGYVEPPQTQE